MGERDAPDPYEVLGLAPGASQAEITSSYRELAKLIHPDSVGDQDANQQMATLNAAYGLLRGGEAAGNAQTARNTIDRERARERRSSPQALFPYSELRESWMPGETLHELLAVSTWNSPQTVLVLSDRRLLWLLDDAPVHRVRELDLKLISDVTTGRVGIFSRDHKLRVASKIADVYEFSGLNRARAENLARLISRAITTMQQR